jgi:hypothetical protein
MIAEKLADEIRREAKAGSVEHSRPGTNVCIWPILLQKSAIVMVRLRHRFSGTVFLRRRV